MRNADDNKKIMSKVILPVKSCLSSNCNRKIPDLCSFIFITGDGLSQWYM